MLRLRMLRFFIAELEDSICVVAIGATHFSCVASAAHFFIYKEIITMYDNIGKKIKDLATAAFIFGTIIAVIFGLILANDTDGLSILLIIVGPIISWISSLTLYGFGELIDKVCEIAKNTTLSETKSEAQSKTDFERINKIEKLRAQGLITEEEYVQAISKIHKEAIYNAGK